MKQTVDFLKMKRNQEMITMVTAYDAPTAKIVEDAAIDLILVGDSLGMVVHGHQGTQPVTLDDMLLHTKAVARGAKQTFIVGDLPFMTYHRSIEDTVTNATTLVQTGGAHAVKLEGCTGLILDSIERLTSGGIAVMGHLGLTPQSSTVLGGFKVQGRGEQERTKLIEDAKRIEASGAFALVVECIPESLTKELKDILAIPVIGIGAGKADGQVLVFHDLVGLTTGYIPKFAKTYANVHDVMLQAVEQYRDDVKRELFPDERYTFKDVKKERSTSV
ncbi:3-methyl-2-oxobutanoate hydroxymethyltransferase [Geomicrobium sediminis]|uniref:3-methyl-2-oxobutanoate hydroxymethyltransferase n=1 Tax=Geomicrobium sediminis TaxID=1347788 RepID=A0ABS2PEV4_9BACL|nr:3-methyl-2-oxobutanoate hydroxymethyltransferase [Geomicrobium sediminis]MBM7633501.1 3-methyl-2-oxobutanoate hydroxymethyltransferase [Geomicrobium sediminis]